jgi:uncharacterized protein YegL
MVAINGGRNKYKKLPIGTHQPGLILILIDQSESMTHPCGYGGMSKQEFAALAVNRCIYDIMNACRAGDRVMDRCHIGVVGYGQTTDILVAGRPSELGQQIKRIQTFTKKVTDGAGALVDVEQRMPIWIEPQAKNGSPMDKAFDFVAELIQAWVAENPDNFPPVVINITGGEPNSPAQAETAARRLIGLGTSDGTVLLLNAHIADSAAQEIKLPSDEKGLPNEFAKLLFRMSSELPEPMVAAAINAGFAPSSRARGFVVNASAETLTKLIIFGSAYVRR